MNIARAFLRLLGHLRVLLQHALQIVRNLGVPALVISLDAAKRVK